MNNKVFNKFLRRVYFLFPLLLLVLMALIYVFPLIVMFTTSFKTLDEAFDRSVSILPTSLYLENYIRVFEKIPFVLYFRNTLWITIMNVVGTVFCSPMVAYSLSKVRWAGRNILFTVLTSTMLIPYTVTMIPMYRMWTQVHLVGTFWPLIIPAFFGYPFYIVLLRQFMLTLPDELLEAAKIDGCNAWQRFSRVALPLTKPGLATIIIFSFMLPFSDFLGPLLYANSQRNYTLALGLHAFLNEHWIDWTGLMAATTLFVLPILVVFIVGQKQFVEGISTSGLKG
jgi:multiple sugar transport system permease protein